MVGTALRRGLAGWARAPVRAGIGSAVLLGLWLLAYAIVIEISPDFWVTLALWGLLANLALGGWMLFCLDLADGEKPAWLALIRGFRRPLGLTLAGIAGAAIVVLPLSIAGFLAGTAGAPDWALRVIGLGLACLFAPAALFGVLGGATGGRAPRVIARSIGCAVVQAPSLTALALLTFGLAAAGPLPGLLLERHALAQIAALLPSDISEYALASVRLVALLGGIISLSAAGCVWAAAWRASNAE